MATTQNIQEPMGGESFPPNAAEATLAHTFALFARQLEDKVASLERNVLALKEQIEGPDTLQAAFKEVVRALPQVGPLGPAAAQPVNHGAGGRPLIGLHASGQPRAKNTSQYAVEGLERRWYAKKVMPDFKVRLLSTDGQYRGSDSPAEELSVQLLDGHGQYINHLLQLYTPDSSAKLPVTAPLKFPIVDGVAVVSGLRFMGVSSKHGKSFRLELSCPEHSLIKFKTEEIAVLSERLKSEKKATDMEELRPDDDICRVPGIGKSYLQRWNQLGFKTVRDLASIPVAPKDRPTRVALLERLRKSRGALTEARLMHLIRDAHAVVDRENERQQQQQVGAIFTHTQQQEPQQRMQVRVSEPDTPSLAAAMPVVAPPVFAPQMYETEAQASQRKLSFDNNWQGTFIEEIPITPGADVRQAPMIEFPTTPTVEAVDAMINFDDME